MLQRVPASSWLWCLNASQSSLKHPAKASPGRCWRWCLQEYALTDDIAGMAAGGQILMGPKTFQRQVHQQ
jgi:hypothetical protein